MRRTIIGFFSGLAMCAAAVAGNPAGYTPADTNVTGVNIFRTNAICVLPARGALAAAPAWSAISGTVVRVGQDVLNSSGVRYYAVTTTGLTATNQPVHTSGVATAIDGISWQWDAKSMSHRTGLSVTKTSTNGANYIWVSVGYPAVANQGTMLSALGSTFLIPLGAPQDAIYVIAGATNDSVSAQDW